MNTETVDISTLTPDPANVRKHDQRNLDAIKGSLKRFGQQKPIVVDADGVVVAGNGTLEAAKALGWTQIAVARTELRGAEATAFAIADNRTAELAAWDDEALAETLAALQNDESIDQLATGFSDAEIEKLIGGSVGLDEEADANVPELYQVVAECTGEAEQQKVYDWLEREGVKCRVSTL